MKPLLLILLCFLLFSCSEDMPDGKRTAAKIISKDLKNENLKGKVRSLIVVELGKTLSGDFQLMEKTTSLYNELGNLTEDMENGTGDTLSIKTVYKYNEKNLRTEVDYYSNFSPGGKTKYMYDSTGHMIECYTYESDTILTDKFIHKYDDKFNLIEVAHYGANGQIVDKFSNKFDEQGNVIESRSWRAGETTTIKLKYKYDEMGDMIERNNYNENNELIHSVTYKYSDFDNMGNWQTKTSYKDDDAIRITKRTIEYYQ